MNVGRDFIQNCQNQMEKNHLQQSLAQSVLYTQSFNIKQSHFVFVNHQPVQIKFRYFSPSSCKKQIKRYDSLNQKEDIKQSKISNFKKITLNVDSKQVSEIYSIADQNYSKSSKSRKRKKKTVKNIKQQSQLYYKNSINQIQSNLLNQFQQFQKQIFDIKVKKKKIIKLNPNRNRSKITKFQTQKNQNQDFRIINSQIISKYQTPIRTICLIDKSILSQKFHSQEKQKKINKQKQSKIKIVSSKDSRKSKQVELKLEKENKDDVRSFHNYGDLKKTTHLKIFLTQSKNTNNQFLRNNFRFEKNITNNISEINSKSKVNSHSKSRKGISVTSSSRSKMKKITNFSKFSKIKNSFSEQNNNQKLNQQKNSNQLENK